MAVFRDTSFGDCSLNSDTFNSTFNSSAEYDEVESPRTTIINQLMKIYTKHKLAEIVLEEIAQLINLSSSIKIPTTSSSLQKEFQIHNKLCVSRNILCTECHQYSNSIDYPKNMICENLNCNQEIKNSNPYFLNIGISAQLKTIILRNYEDINSFRSKLIKTSGIIDVYSGNILKQILSDNDEFIHALCLNTDGVEIYNSTNGSLWPIIISCSFLSPEIRFLKKNLILAGLYFGSTKPDFLRYFDMIAREMNSLRNNGLNINSHSYKFAITNASLDLPAKSAVSKMKQFNGYFACAYCEQKGVKTKKGIRYTVPQKAHPINCTNKGDIPVNKYKLRNHDGIKLIVKSNIGKRLWVNEKGIRGVPATISFRDFDLARSYFYDIMHGGFLGVVKKLISLYLNPSSIGKKYYIGPMAQRKLNSRLISIRTIRSISRKPRNLKYFKKFTATEFRNILLYYFVIFDGILTSEYFEHLKLFSITIYTLLKPSITSDQLDACEKNLVKFVRQYQKFFGPEQMTMNIHNLTHIVESVKDNGPLWAQAMFPFEKMNGHLKNYVVGTRNPTEQIANKFLIDSVNYKRSEKKPITSYCYGQTQHVLTELEEIEFNKVNVVINDHCEIYSAYKSTKNIIFTSVEYTRAKKTVDFFVETIVKKVGKVRFYLKKENKVYALLQEYEIMENTSHGHILAVEEKSTIRCVEVDSIVGKFINIKFGFVNYVTSKPNNYEAS